MKLETERLCLHPWGPDDWQALRPIARHPDVMRYITGGIPWEDQQVREFVERQLKYFNELGFCMWRLTERNQSDLIGLCGLQPMPDSTEIEIGWWLIPEHWGKGYATEAAQCALADVFARSSLDRVVAVARPDNTASRRVMVKLGMRYEEDSLRRGIPVVKYAVSRTLEG